MSVHIELEPERAPRWDTQVTQAEFFVNKIKVIMKTFALIWFKKRFACILVVPGLVGIAAFHGRKNMDESFCLSGVFDDCLDTVIFPEGL